MTWTGSHPSGALERAPPIQRYSTVFQRSKYQAAHVRRKVVEQNQIGVDRPNHRQCVFATRRDEHPMSVLRQQLGDQLKKPRAIVDDENRVGRRGSRLIPSTTAGYGRGISPPAYTDATEPRSRRNDTRRPNGLRQRSPRVQEHRGARARRWWLASSWSHPFHLYRLRGLSSLTRSTTPVWTHAASKFGKNAQVRVKRIAQPQSCLEHSRWELSSARKEAGWALRRQLSSVPFQGAPEDATRPNRQGVAQSPLKSLGTSEAPRDRKLRGAWPRKPRNHPESPTKWRQK